MTGKLSILILSFCCVAQLWAQSPENSQLLQDLEYLSSTELEGRKPLSEGSLKARVYIKERFRHLGLSSQFTDYTQYFDFTHKGERYENAANILAFIPGRATEELFVIMAHYDHLGIIDGEVYHGADDNASGVAGLLHIASALNQLPLQHSVILVALDAEEMGKLGAQALVEDFPFSLEQVRLAVNMDMISRSEEGKLFAVGPGHYPVLKPALEGVPLLHFGHEGKDDKEDWTMASDHAAFHQEGIPFVYFGVEDHPDYHQPGDTFKNIHKDFYTHAVESILSGIRNLDQHLLRE